MSKRILRLRDADVGWCPALILWSLVWIACAEGAEREAAGKIDAAAPEATVSSAPLTLELFLPRSEVRLGEPVTALAVLRNIGTEPLSLRPLLDLAYGRLGVWIAPPDEPEQRLRLPVLAEARGTSAIQLEPGAAWSEPVPLYFSGQGWVLKRPGPYQVRLEYASELGKLSTPSRPLRVKSPRSPAEAKAATLMMRPAAAAFVYFGGPTGRDDGRTSLELVRNLDPHGSLAPYVEMTLDLEEATPSYDQVTETFRPARCTELAPRLVHTMGRIDDPLFAARVAAALARCLRDSGRAAEAEEVIRGFYGAHPEVRSWPGAESWLERSAQSKRR